MNLLLSVGLLIFLPIYSFAANSGDDADVAIEDVVNNTITEIVVKDVSKNNESYWTQEKLNQVKPYPIPTVHPTKKHSHYRYEHVNSSQTDASCEKFDKFIKNRKNCISLARDQLT